VEEPATPALPEPAAASAWSEPEAAPVTAEAEPEAAAAAWSEPEPEPEPATEAWEAPAAEGETAPVWTAPDPEPEPVAAATEEAPATVFEPAPDHGPIFESAGAESNGNGNGNGTNLDTVFSVPAAPPSPDEGLLAAGVVVNTEAEGFAPQSLQISKFDQKKLDFLRGKAAHRDIKDSAGIILVAKDELLDQPALERIVQGGVLGEVFIEMTLKK